MKLSCFPSGPTNFQHPWPPIVTTSTAQLCVLQRNNSFCLFWACHQPASFSASGPCIGREITQPIPIHSLSAFGGLFNPCHTLPAPSSSASLLIPHKEATEDSCPSLLLFWPSEKDQNSRQSPRGKCSVDLPKGMVSVLSCCPFTTFHPCHDLLIWVALSWPFHWAVAIQRFCSWAAKRVQSPLL